MRLSRSAANLRAGPRDAEAFMIVGVPSESVQGERRVALVPELVGMLTKAGLEVWVQAGAGAAAGLLDSAYGEVAARLKPEVLTQADILLKVQPPTDEEIGRIREGAILIGFLQPHANAAAIKALAARRITAFSMTLMPRI